MPEITRFYGIMIKMFFGQNYPHIFALYDEYIGIIDIQTLEMLEGDLPDRAESFVIEWAKTNQKDLLEMWDKKEVKKLKPLE
ncbi:hypothetical protein FACS1894105_08990 [Clostridia bacterium]|nr:hypothetical protein FACS1894105_08990 [Clostridia bacterium]